jgi:hypothetical protein
VPEVTVIHVAAVVAVQTQPVPADTAIGAPAPPELLGAALDGVTDTAQPSA